MVKNLPANAEDVGSSPDTGRSHMPQLLSLRAATTESSSCAPQQEKPLQGEARAPELESSHHSPQPEKLVQLWRCSTAQNK